nr:reverse transcriptase domain-containing protein [Tanacetum cinerariifolium]
ESPKNSSEENVVSKTNQEPPHDSDIHHLIEECSIEVPKEQKQNMEKTMLDLVKICHHKQFLCIHDDVDDLIESALDSKLLSINSINSQRLDKKEQEVKIVEEQPAERIENVADDPEGDICFFEKLLIDDSILSHESFDSSFKDNPSISRPPPEPPDDNFNLEPKDYFPRLKTSCVGYMSSFQDLRSGVEKGGMVHLAAPYGQKVSESEDWLVNSLMVLERRESIVCLIFKSLFTLAVNSVRTLQTLEVNNNSMEKLVLALVHATRRLRRYFQAYPVVVVTDQPIKQIMSRPENTERILKWRFELEAFDITYRPRTSIRDQVLADFIAKRPDEEGSPIETQVEELTPEPYTIFKDGSSCLEGSGAGLILTSPEREEFTYALREGEPTEAFMERFKVESTHVSGASKCTRISRFMHGITNPDLIKKINDNILKSVDEMMSVTTTFLRGEVAAANQSKKKVLPAWKYHETSHRQNFDKRLNFKGQHKSGRRQDRFTPLTKTPKEILAMETVKFKAPPPMTGLVENWNKNKFCEFHGDKGHNTNECIHLRRRIEEALKSGQLSYLVKEIKQRRKRGEQEKAVKKGEAPNKEKATTRKFISHLLETVADKKPKFIQRYHRPPGSEKNLSGPIYRSRNAKIPSERRNNDDPQQYYNTSGVQNGSRSTKFPSTQRTNGHRRNQSSNPPRVSGINRHDRTPLEHPQRMPTHKAKRIGQAPDRNKAIQEEVSKLVEAKIMREVHYHDWISNPFMVSRSENKIANALRKIASTSSARLTEQVLVETLKRKSIEEKQILIVVEEEGYCWMTPLIEYLTKVTLPAKIKKEHAIKTKARQTTSYTDSDCQEKSYLTTESSSKTTHSKTGTRSSISSKGMPSLRCAKVNQAENDKGLLLNLDILKERREKATVHEARNKAKMEKYYNAKVRSISFHTGDFIYRSNEASHAKESGKLGPKWEGSYEVVEALRKGVYKLRNRSGDRPQKPLVERFVKNLVMLMTREDLELQNKSGNTTLCLAVVTENVKSTMAMVNKNGDMLDIARSGRMLPLYLDKVKW